jgi:hypothetical protein
LFFLEGASPTKDYFKLVSSSPLLWRSTPWEFRIFRQEFSGSVCPHLPQFDRDDLFIQETTAIWFGLRSQRITASSDTVVATMRMIPALLAWASYAILSQLLSEYNVQPSLDM